MNSNIVIIIVCCVIFYFIYKSMHPKDKEDTELEEIFKEKGFFTDKVFQYSIKYQFRIDFNNKKIAICRLSCVPQIDIIDFSNVIECKIIENSNVLDSGRSW